MRMLDLVADVLQILVAKQSLNFRFTDSMIIFLGVKRVEGVEGGGEERRR